LWTTSSSIFPEKYAHQARNFEAERRAAQLRILSETRTGELMKAQEKAKGAAEKGTMRAAERGKTTTRSNGATVLPPKTLKGLGISRDQASRWQQLAENPTAVEN
jgi:hypothetical protein